MNQSKITHQNFIIPEEINIYFCELKNPDEETKNEILKSIQFLRNKQQMKEKKNQK